MKIAEVAELLGVSKKTIYRRVDSLSLIDKGHVKVVGKEKDVDLEGVELIRLSVDSGLTKDKTKDNFTVDTVTTLEDHAIESYKSMLKEQKELYERLLLEKDSLIDDLRKDKDRLMQMQENSQVLLGREQEKILLLEESVEKKSFWSRFKKNPSSL